MSSDPQSKQNSGSIEDIPEAIRNVPQASTLLKQPQVVVYKPAAGILKQKSSLPWIGTGGIVLIALAGGVFLWLRSQTPVSVSSVSKPSATVQPASPSGTADQLLGHFAYAVAPESALELVSPGDSILLRKTTAAAYRQMVAAAANDGVSITLISGFRNLEDQNHLFFDVKQQRGQTAKQRAEVSAPPGYSEHHTGYAVDIGDAQAPATNLSQSFEETAAFQWMKKHAAQYNFEISFPLHNPQGVSYEPWHWRFIGDRDSLETFYKARASANLSAAPAK